MNIIQFMRLNPDKTIDIPLPMYMTKNSSGMDIRAANDDIITISPGQRHLIPTGFAMAIMPGYEAQIRPRSGLAIKHGITVINTPGTIDADYRGEVKIGLINLGSVSFDINRGDRIAQMIIMKVEQAIVSQVNKLPETERNTGGFGSTGI